MNECLHCLDQLRKKIESNAKPTKNVRWDIRMTKQIIISYIN